MFDTLSASARGKAVPGGNRVFEGPRAHTRIAAQGKTIATRGALLLCDACSPFVTLTFDRERGVITVPLPDGAGKKTVRVISLDETAPVARTGTH